MKLSILLGLSVLGAAAGPAPWMNQSLGYEERLKLFVAQLNTTQKLAMTQGDTEVSSAQSRYV